MSATNPLSPTVSPGDAALLDVSLYPHNQQLSLDAFLSDDIEAVTTWTAGEVSFFLELLNQLPGTYRGTWLEAVLAGADPTATAYNMARRYAKFQARHESWEDFWAGGLPDVLLVGAASYFGGWLTGYGSAWLGAKVASWIGGFSGAVYGVAAGAATSYGIRYVARQAIQDLGGGDLSMYAFDVGLVVGAAGLNPVDPLEVKGEIYFGVGYNEGWTEEVVDALNYVAGGGEPIPWDISISYNEGWFRNIFVQDPVEHLTDPWAEYSYKYEIHTWDWIKKLFGGE
jgi:hypothetical protein